MYSANLVCIATIIHAVSVAVLGLAGDKITKGCNVVKSVTRAPLYPPHPLLSERKCEYLKAFAVIILNAQL